MIRLRIFAAVAFAVLVVASFCVGRASSTKAIVGQQQATHTSGPDDHPVFDISLSGLGWVKEPNGPYLAAPGTLPVKFDCSFTHAVNQLPIKAKYVVRVYRVEDQSAWVAHDESPVFAIDPGKSVEHHLSPVIKGLNKGDHILTVYVVDTAPHMDRSGVQIIEGGPIVGGGYTLARKPYRIRVK